MRADRAIGRKERSLVSQGLSVDGCFAMMASTLQKRASRVYRAARASGQAKGSENGGAMGADDAFPFVLLG